MVGWNLLYTADTGDEEKERDQRSIDYRLSGPFWRCMDGSIRMEELLLSSNSYRIHTHHYSDITNSYEESRREEIRLKLLERATPDSPFVSCHPFSFLTE